MIDLVFFLEVSVDDEVSDVILIYVIGIYRGGLNVVDWMGMKGFFLIVLVSLLNGIFLYWIVKVRNSNGGIVIVECFLYIYDNIIFDGWIEVFYVFISYLNIILGIVIVFDDFNFIVINFYGVGFF